MAKVTVTYNAWDHNREVIPAVLQPRVGFRPIKTSLASGLMTNREVWGTLGGDGSGQVQLESEPDVFYVPFMDWLVVPGAAEHDARGHCEWDPIYPGQGGPIDQLPPPTRFAGFLYGFGDPPQHIRRRNDVIYIDISGADDGYWQPWAPEGTYVEGGAQWP